MPKKLKRFVVQVERKAVGYREFTVEAASEAEAKNKAVELACDDDWTDTCESEYDAFSVHKAE
jgi:hypothetical protein